MKRRCFFKALVGLALAPIAGKLAPAEEGKYADCALTAEPHGSFGLTHGTVYKFDHNCSVESVPLEEILGMIRKDFEGDHVTDADG